MSAADFHVLRRRLRLTGELVTVTALRVGSGGAGELDGADLPVLRDRDGFPYIPGASAKGVLRATIESLLRGALPDRSHPLWPCDPHHEAPRESDRDGACGFHKSNQRAHAEASIDRHCPVCRLFGSRVLASHVRITDARVHADQRVAPPPIEIRDSVGIDRDLRTARNGLKYDFEVVSPGTRFALEVFVDNPEPWLMGLLLVAFEQLDEGFAALGGFSSRGLGRVRWRWAELRSIDARALLVGKPETVHTDVDRVFAGYREALAKHLEEGPTHVQA
ncbi:CRISPR-associated RAMP protein Csx7 [Nannocystis exedens]|nr:CRISPR-associated RAMP protein Csx7 [Nannocystis exedens]PCC74662.1 CRISPR-associated RAMP protein [Nannocystis exedens]